MMRAGRAGSALGRIGPPVLRLLLITAAAGVIYHAAWRIPIRAAHQAVSTAAIAAYFAGLWLGALYVWIACAGRGASIVERVLACSVVPLLWMAKEVIRVGRVWPLPDALFFALNPLGLSVACVAISEMGLAELILRRGRRARGEIPRVLAPAPVAAFLLPQLFTWIFTALPDRAAATFFVFLKLYARVVHGSSLEY